MNTVMPTVQKILKLPATFQYHQNSHPTELAVFAFKMF
jgi:hypothetical protein